MKEKMTIHRALSELKTMGARIDKQISELMPSAIVQKGKLIGGVTQADFESNAKTGLQSIKDLIDRRNKIKSAVVISNGTTKVIIAKAEMTVADAINQKAVIEFRKNLIHRLRVQHLNTLANLEKNNTKVESDALNLASVALAKQNVKLTDDDAVKVTGSFLEAYKFALVDPLGADKVIKEMESELVAFATEVDATLSEINATTYIEF